MKFLLKKCSKATKPVLALERLLSIFVLYLLPCLTVNLPVLADVDREDCDLLINSKSGLYSLNI